MLAAARLESVRQFLLLGEAVHVQAGPLPIHQLFEVLAGGGSYHGEALPYEAHTPAVPFGRVRVEPGPLRHAGQFKLFEVRLLVDPPGHGPEYGVRIRAGELLLIRVVRELLQYALRAAGLLRGRERLLRVSRAAT